MISGVACIVPTKGFNSCHRASHSAHFSQSWEISDAERQTTLKVMWSTFARPEIDWTAPASSQGTFPPGTSFDDEARPLAEGMLE
jgi:hypothetical protein